VTPQSYEDHEGGWAEQDWLKHSIGGDNSTPPLSAFQKARSDWASILGRGGNGNGTGPWAPLGPTIGLNDLTNKWRDRSVYTTGTENFAGRTAHAVISPDCQPGSCALYIAATNGGIWKTDDALAADPTWEFVSGTFEQQNTSSLELDPNDPSHRTIWAGTGEPNACSSGCEVGVGLYLSRDGGKGWKGPFGRDVFDGRGVGSIEVKPGDSNTIFAASARATRGISNTCCGGADALIPGAPHFGLYRSTDGGASWQLVNQGASALCSGEDPNVVALGGTPCSPRGARRVKVDPVDPNTVYASFFARGIWRSRSNGDPGTWEQIMAPVAPTKGTINGTETFFNNERDEFDVVALANGATRMYVGAGAGVQPNDPDPTKATATVPVAARFRRNDDVRSAPAATVASAWTEMTSTAVNSPGWSSAGYCDPQCQYDNYVYAPANPDNAPNSGAGPDVVYLSGANQYTENNAGTGRSNGRAVLVSTDAGATFTDLTEDDRDDIYPGALHPDHHALVVNPSNWKQFFDFSDGGVNRSNGVFVNDSGDCTKTRSIYSPFTFTIAARIAFCQFVLSRIPERLTAINRGLRTLAFYTADYDRNNVERIAGGTQDNGSWETLGGTTWLQVYIADGGPNRFDATGHDSQFALTASQSGALSVRYDAQKQEDVNWISDTLADPTNVPPYANEGVPFIAAAETDPKQAGWMWTGREHVFRSQNYGRNPVLATKQAHRDNCNVWYGAFGDLNGDGKYTLPEDACDDWKALGDPSPAGRLTSTAYGTDRTGVYVSAVERAYTDTSTLWAATGAGRIFVSKNADAADPAAVKFTRIDNLDPKAPGRYPTAIFVDRANPNHAWISYSGYNAKTPTTPGHVFEVTFTSPASPNGAAKAVFTNLDGTQNNAFGDIPANSIVATPRGTLYVGTDYGVLIKEAKAPVWKASPPGLPNLDVPDLVYVPEKGAIYAVTHGQGIWELKAQK